MSTNNIQLSNVASQFLVPTWDVYPGIKMRFDLPNPSVVDPLFRGFVNKRIQEACKLLTTLDHKKNFNEVHLLFTTITTFTTYIDDLVEHYQNQFEQKDEKLDEEYLKLKRLLAKNSTQIWAKGEHQIQEFLGLLKTKLNSINAIPEGFDENIVTWSKILNLQYMSNVTLLAIINGKDDVVPQSYQLHKSGDPKNTFKIISPIPYHVLSDACALALRQLLKNASWIIPEMLDKLKPLEDEKLETQLSLVTAMDEAQKSIPVSSLVQYYAREMKSLLNQLSSLNINDNDQILKLTDKFEKIMITVCDRTKDFEPYIEKIKNDPNPKQTYLLNELISVTASHALVQPLLNFSKCVQLKYSYLDIPLINLSFILQGIRKANDKWNAYQTRGEIPPLFFGPIIPHPHNSEDAEECARKLLAELSQSSKQPSSRKKGARGTKGKQQKQNIKASKQKATIEVPKTSTGKKEKKKQVSLANVPSPSIEIATPVSSIERLKEKLTALFHQNPSPALRQAIWHLGHLIVIQNGLKNSSFSPSDDLSLIAAVANFAQKTMEQTYRHCLKEEGEPFERTHNLKIYHQKFDPKFDPNSTKYPWIVGQLFLINNWFRYFYLEHERWNSATTFQVKIPSVLEQLFKIAEGHPYSEKDLKKSAEEIIELTCKQIEVMLGETESSKHLSALPLGHFEEVQVKKQPLQEKMFGEIQQTLEGFLSNFNRHHPVYLQVKQAVAALKMLEAGIRQMNKAKDIRTFSTWTVWSLLQLQESMENILHSIEYYTQGDISIQHELTILSEQLQIDMGSLSGAMQQLSYKVRYPVEVNNKSVSSKIINNLDALEWCPELQAGFQLQSIPKILFGTPSEGISLNAIIQEMNQLFTEGKTFLRTKAIPALQKSFAEHQH